MNIKVIAIDNVYQNNVFSEFYTENNGISKYIKIGNVYEMVFYYEVSDICEIKVLKDLNAFFPRSWFVPLQDWREKQMKSILD